MIKLNSHKDSTIQFDVDVKNVGGDNLRGYFRLMHENVEYGFPVNIDGRRAKVIIPALNGVIANLTTESVLAARLEFIGGSDYVSAWEDEAQVHVPPQVKKVEIKVEQQEKLGVTISAANLTEPEPKKKVTVVAPVVSNIEVSDAAWEAAKPRPIKKELSEKEIVAANKEYYTKTRADLNKGILEKTKTEGKGGFGAFFAEAKTKIKTKKKLGHWHDAEIDDEGDGITTATWPRVKNKKGYLPGHTHKIIGAEVQPDVKKDGHTHPLEA